MPTAITQSSSLPSCKLCLLQPADKRNSHIIPKFMCTRLFEETTPRHALSVKSSGKELKIQDTSKEDYLLCSTCEKRMEVVETYMAPVIRRMHNYKKFGAEFHLHQIAMQQFLRCHKLHPALFKLFIYSLIWRTSASSLAEFAPFSLPPADQERIRLSLDKRLQTTKKDLLDSLGSIDDIPAYHFTLIKPKEMNEYTRGIFSAASMSNHTHILLLVDFALMFYTDEESIGPVLIHFSNKQNEMPIIPLGDTEPWNDLNRLYYKKMKRSK